MNMKPWHLEEGRTNAVYLRYQLGLSRTVLGVGKNALSLFARQDGI
jgi:hypothetical protein